MTEIMNIQDVKKKDILFMKSPLYSSLYWLFIKINEPLFDMEKFNIAIVFLISKFFVLSRVVFSFF